MIELKIKDIPWKFRVLQDEHYEKLHGKESHGITDKYKMIVDFKLSSLTPNLVRHELAHVYYASCCNNSTNDIESHDVEEIFAELIEFHLEDILKLSKHSYSALVKEAKKLKKPKNE